MNDVMNQHQRIGIAATTVRTAIQIPAIAESIATGLGVVVRLRRAAFAPSRRKR